MNLRIPTRFELRDIRNHSLITNLLLDVSFLMRSKLLSSTISILLTTSLRSYSSIWFCIIFSITLCDHQIVCFDPGLIPYKHELAKFYTEPNSQHNSITAIVTNHPSSINSNYGTYSLNRGATTASSVISGSSNLLRQIPYPLPVTNTFSSYSISLPFQTKFYGSFKPNYYAEMPTIIKEFPKPSPVKYLPGPQYCPETGRTVCSKVSPYYPLDEVLMVVKMMQATRFNLSSEFVDESENASEPFPNEDYEEYGDFDTFSPSFDSGRSYREDKYRYDAFHNQQSSPQQSPYFSRTIRPFPSAAHSWSSYSIRKKPSNELLAKHFYNLDWKFGQGFAPPFSYSPIGQASTIGSLASSSTITATRQRLNSESYSNFTTTNSSNLNYHSNSDINVEEISNIIPNQTDPIIVMEMKRKKSPIQSDLLYGSVKTIRSKTSSNSSPSFASPIDHYNERVIARPKRQISSDNEFFSEQLCPSRVILLEPKAALNDRRQWKYVVNLAERDPRLKQAIKVEVCT